MLIPLLQSCRLILFHPTLPLSLLSSPFSSAFTRFFFFAKQDLDFFFSLSLFKAAGFVSRCNYIRGKFLLSRNLPMSAFFSLLREFDPTFSGAQTLEEPRRTFQSETLWVFFFFTALP